MASGHRDDEPDLYRDLQPKREVTYTYDDLTPDERRSLRQSWPPLKRAAWSAAVWGGFLAMTWVFDLENLMDSRRGGVIALAAFFGWLPVLWFVIQHFRR